MPDMQLLARIYHLILTAFVQHGRAPHFTDLAAALGVSVDQARHWQRDLLGVLGGPHWLHPDTDLLVGFAPFSNLPTPYRIAVDGEQNWYGECGLEALAVSWLFPGKEIRIATRCLDCAAPLGVRMRDGTVIEAVPETIVGQTNLPLQRWAENWAYT